ncbi:MAG: ABC transporter substrate-binding protein, partial [Caldilinea sp.]
HIFDFYYEHNRRTLAAAGRGNVDLFYLAEDLGSQGGPLMSLETYRRFLRPGQIKMAELMQPALKEIGIDLKIEQLEWSTWIDTVVVKGDYDMEIVLISGGSDPDDFFYQWHHTGEVFNIWRYSDPEMDSLLEQGRTTVAQDARKEIYYKIQEKLIEDVPLAHIIYRDQIMATNAAVQNFPMRLDSVLRFNETWLNR